MSTHRFLRFKKIHYYLIPLASLVVWWGMLIAMLSCWSLQGHPIYAFMGHVSQDPVYISDVGATNLQPLFISCAGFQAIFFVGTLIMEFFLRRQRKLQPYVSTKQPKFAIVSIICGLIGQLGIIFVSIFNTVSFHTVHLTMVAVFIVFVFFSCVFNFLNTFIFGNYPQRLSPDHEKVIFGTYRWANLYIVSFCLKILWVVVAIVFAVLFGYYMDAGKDSLSAIFEWSISFWYGTLLIMWSMDLFPSAIKHYKRRNPDEFMEKPVSFEVREEDANTISTYGSPTYIGSDNNQMYYKETNRANVANQSISQINHDPLLVDRETGQVVSTREEIYNRC